ncbi:MAG: hypothetical protein SFV15_08595 [Polyangiaceae bacterium]|nr:hypothetical protein [Polyangiaceae bacterium]
MNPEQQQIIACMDAFIEDMVRAVDQTIRQTIAAELERIRANPIVRVKGPKATRRPKREPAEARARKPREPRAPKERPPSARKAKELAPEAPPAPLFVYKRAKDGRIERLNRRDEPGNTENELAENEPTPAS